MCQKINSERLTAYQDVIQTVHTIIADAIHKGIQDGSISSQYKDCENELYYSIMHTLFSASQKLSLSGKMLQMDEANDDIQQLKLLGKIIIGGLK